MNVSETDVSFNDLLLESDTGISDSFTNTPMNFHNLTTTSQTLKPSLNPLLLFHQTTIFQTQQRDRAYGIGGGKRTPVHGLTTNSIVPMSLPAREHESYKNDQYQTYPAEYQMKGTFDSADSECGYLKYSFHRRHKIIDHRETLQMQWLYALDGMDENDICTKNPHKANLIYTSRET